MIYNLRRVAVLIPIVCHSTPILLLTRRAAAMRKHTGQGCVSGREGSTDADNVSAISTALREVREKFIIDLRQVLVLGQLPLVDSSSGFSSHHDLGPLAPAKTEWRKFLKYC